MDGGAGQALLGPGEAVQAVAAGGSSEEGKEAEIRDLKCYMHTSLVWILFCFIAWRARSRPLPPAPAPADARCAFACRRDHFVFYITQYIFFIRVTLK